MNAPEWPADRREREWEDIANEFRSVAVPPFAPRWLRLLRTIATTVLALAVIALWWLFWLEVP